MSIAEETTTESQTYDWSRSVGVVEMCSMHFEPEGGFRCEKGAQIAALDVAYETYGTLNAAGDNAILITPALTADAHVAGFHGSRANAASRGWWDVMIGPGKPVDTGRWFVVCSSLLGGCSGTTGPLSVNPGTGKAWGGDFPEITIGDMVEVQKLLLDALGVRRLYAVIGGSLGGMQALDWTVRYPDMIDHCALIATAASMSAQNLAFDIVERNAIFYDDDWEKGHYPAELGRGPRHGLALARQIAHITYLSPAGMERKFGRRLRRGASESGRNGAAERFRTAFEVESYLEHQGRKFIDRFDANAYLRITHATDEFDLAATYGKTPEPAGAGPDAIRENRRIRLREALSRSRCNYLIVALSSDWLFPAHSSWEMADALLSLSRQVSFCEIEGDGGHDGFLIESQSKPLEAVLGAFIGGRSADAPSVENNPAERQYLSAERGKIATLVAEGSRVLDVGCGDGTLLEYLQRHRGCRGIGIDIDRDAVTATVRRGLSALQADADDDLGEFSDQSFDYVILNQTLQAVDEPELVLDEILRIGREAIVSFPNFGHWSSLWHIFLKGRMPETRSLPFGWYDTPNLHFFTMLDFLDLCRHKNIEVLDLHEVCDDPLSRFLKQVGLRNLAANRVVARLKRRETVKGGEA